jgi:hypothetical protein
MGGSRDRHDDDDDDDDGAFKSVDVIKTFEPAE